MVVRLVRCGKDEREYEEYESRDEERGGKREISDQEMMWFRIAILVIIILLLAYLIYAFVKSTQELNKLPFNNAAMSTARICFIVGAVITLIALLLTVLVIIFEVIHRNDPDNPDWVTRGIYPFIIILTIASGVLWISGSRSANGMFDE